MNENNNDKYENNNDNNENKNNNYTNFYTVMAVPNDVIDVTENVTAVTLSSVQNNNLRPQSFSFLTDKTNHVDDSTQKDVEKLMENENNGITMVNNCHNNGNNNGIQQHHANEGNDQVYTDDNACTINIAEFDEDEEELTFQDEINQTTDDEINIKFNTRIHATHHLTPTSSKELKCL